MKKIISVVMVIMIFTGCASIISSPKQKVKVTAAPGDAHVVITADNGKEYYNGNPSEITLPRKYEYSVVVSMPGFLDQKILITKNFNGWLVGNLCFGGIPGGLLIF